MYFAPEGPVANSRDPAMGSITSLSPSTLTAEESDRLVRIARLVGMAHELMGGDGEAARRWLAEGNELLEGESPLERASTEGGGREVEQLIGRLRHGTFS